VFGSDDGNIYALRRVDGTEVWTVATGGQVRSSPIIAAGRVYVGSYDNTVYGLDTETGDVVWTAPVGAGTTTLTIDGERLFTNLVDGQLIALAG